MNRNLSGVFGAPRRLILAAALAGLLGIIGCAGAGGTNSFQGTGAVSVSPSPVAFGNVVVGQTNTQTVSMSNTGTQDVTVSSVSMSGSSFSVSGLAAPLTLSSGQTATFTVSFQPTVAGSESAAISLAGSTSGANSSSWTGAIHIKGKGVKATTQLQTNTSAVSFGSVTVGTSSSRSVVVTNTGNSDVTIPSVAASGTGFQASGGSNTILGPNQSVTVNVDFDPQAAGSVSGKLSITSDASSAPLQVSLSGKGVAASQSNQPNPQESVALAWSASSSSVMGYNVYRGSVSGGPYSRLNSSVDPSASYTDATVSGGLTYYYVVTSVSSSNVESSYSNQVSVTVPSS